MPSLKSVQSGLVYELTHMVRLMREELHGREYDAETMLAALRDCQVPSYAHQPNYDLRTLQHALERLISVARLAGITNEQIGLLMTGQFEDEMTVRKQLDSEEFGA